MGGGGAGGRGGAGERSGVQFIKKQHEGGCDRVIHDLATTSVSPAATAAGGAAVAASFASASAV